MNSNGKKNGLIMIPYAELQNYNSGVNIANQKNRQTVYLKNCCVALLSARACNGDNTDVALVTNIDLPNEYKTLLESKKIKIFFQDFDRFLFSSDYNWSLAFYKLCALYNTVRKYDYDYYCYLDSDVYIQSSFNNIWRECDKHILLYDINHGFQVEHYKHFLNEVNDYTGADKAITHFGGEFFAANRENSLSFSNKCLEIFTDMKDRNFITTHGDEFIISIAAEQYGGLVKNAGAYVFRFWTDVFRLVSTCYINNPVSVIHVPDEKEYGMITLFDKYFSKSRPVKAAQIYRILHLKHRSLKTVYCCVKSKLLKRR